jgi:hypothetical protein
LVTIDTVQLKKLMSGTKKYTASNSGRIKKNFIKAEAEISLLQAVKICRSRFEQMVGSSKVKIVKKKRKIYVPFSEVDRYFTDPSIRQGNPFLQVEHWQSLDHH